MQIFNYLFRHYLYLVTIFFIGRLTLFIIYFDRFSNEDFNYFLSFLFGLKMDTIVATILLLIPLMVLTLTPKQLENFFAKFLKFYFLIVLSFMIYIEVSTLPFMAQYDVRPNYLFVEYLEYPKEVFSMILADYKLQLLSALVLISAFIYAYSKYVNHSLQKVYETKYIYRILLFVPLFLLLFIGARSSFGHRPANLSDAMFSPSRIVNEITKNSTYSIGYAIYAEKKYNANSLIKKYGKMPIDEAISRVKSMLHIENNSTESILTHISKSNFKSESSKNLVIFIQESMGYQFVEAVGGEAGITPNFNALSTEGILFSDMYSNGTRSVRGIAGLVAGNYAIPGRGVVKRNKSQKDFFTIASLLKPFEYHSMFIYGGESRFDNMRGWFLGNGFDEVIDQPKFKNPKFSGTWGVSDEDLVDKANERFNSLYAKNQKFAAVMFSTTNHTPFDFPDGRIELIDGVEKKSVKNAVKFADYAIGKFIKDAKKLPYYKDTIFVIASDHNVRVYGDDIVPVNMFHVPALILGSNVDPQKYEKLSSQPDVLATALDLLGLDISIPVMGRSIFDDKKEEFVLMQFNTTYALRVKNSVAVIQPNKEAETFEYVDNRLVEKEHDIELEKDALALVLTLNHLYNKKLYK